MWTGMYIKREKDREREREREREKKITASFRMKKNEPCTFIHVRKNIFSLLQHNILTDCDIFGFSL